MGKFLKIISWLVAVIVLLIVAAVVVLPQIVDPNDYKQEIVAAVKQETGRDLTIDGNIGLSVFPWLGFETGRMALGNPESLEDPTFASVEHAVIRVKLIPLLQKRLEVDRIGLEGLSLNLIRTPDGVSNWEDLGKGSSPPSAAGAADGPAQAGGYGLEAFSIGGVDISDARIIWDDRQSGQHFSIDQFNLRSGPVISGEPVDLDVDMVVESRTPKARSELTLGGVVALDDATGMLEVSGLKLLLKAEGDGLPGGPVTVVLEAALKAALDGGLLDIAGIVLKADELIVTGDLSGRNLADSATFTGNLELGEFDLRKWLDDHGFAVPEMADPTALKKFGARTALNVQGGAVSLDGLSVRLDDTRLVGSASVKGAAVRFKLDVDGIDVDRYLPGPVESSGKPGSVADSVSGHRQPSAPAAPKSEDQPLFPVETLRALDLDGVLTIGRMIVNKLVAERVQLTVKAAGGQLDLGQKIDAFYQGGYKGALNLDVRGKSPVTRIEGAASSIQIGPLLRDLSGEDRLTGEGRLSTNLLASGNSIGALKRGLSGKLSFQFENGALKGVNVAQTLREAKAKFSGKPLPPSSGPLQTDFSELSGSGVITGGVLDNRDLLAKSPFLRVTGAGKVDLVSETLDYTVQAVVVRSDKGQGGEGLEELEGVNIPVYLTGPYASPSYRIDWEKILLETQKTRIKEKVQEKLDEKLSPELKEKIEKNLPPDLQDKLKGLFN